MSGGLLTVRLSRTDASPWGFRLQGGKDFGTPLLIQKVNGGSLAERAGLQVGDAVVKINNTDVYALRHKDAQDVIVRAGNSFEVTIERGPGVTWKPHVTPVGNIPSPGYGASPVTKTSLAHTKPASQPIGSGHNFSPRPFSGASTPQMNGGDQGMVKSIGSKQYNNPVGLYSEETIAETLSAQAEVLAGGVLGVNFKKNEKSYNAASSEVFKMVQEADKEPREPEPEQVVGGGVPPPVSGLRHVSAPEPKAPSATAPLPAGQNICADCERLIVGVFVRIKDKNLHVECFKCATCGTSLKNVGYYNINNKLYCDIHAKLVARQNPPAPNLDPITVPPGGRIPAGASAFGGIGPQSPQPGTLAPLPFHSGPKPFGAPAPVPAPFSSPSAPYNAPVSAPYNAPTQYSAPAPAVSNLSKNLPGSTKSWPPNLGDQSESFPTATPLYIPPENLLRSDIQTSAFKSFTQSSEADSTEQTVSEQVTSNKRMSICSSEVNEAVGKANPLPIVIEDADRPMSPIPFKDEASNSIVKSEFQSSSQDAMASSHKIETSFDGNVQTIRKTKVEESFESSSRMYSAEISSSSRAVAMYESTRSETPELEQIMGKRFASLQQQGRPMTPTSLAMAKKQDAYPARCLTPEMEDIMNKPHGIFSPLPPASVIRPLTPNQVVVFPPEFPPLQPLPHRPQPLQMQHAREVISESFAQETRDGSIVKSERQRSHFAEGSIDGTSFSKRMSVTENSPLEDSSQKQQSMCAAGKRQSVSETVQRQSISEAGQRQSISGARQRQSISEAGQRQSISEAGQRQSISEASKRQSISEAGKRSSISEAGQRQSISEAGQRQSISEAGQRQSISEAGQRQSISEAGHRQSISEAGQRQSISEAGQRQSISEAGKRQSISEAAKRQSISETGKRQSVSEVGKRQSISETEQGTYQSFQQDNTYLTDSIESRQQLLTQTVQENVNSQIASSVDVVTKTQVEEIIKQELNKILAKEKLYSGLVCTSTGSITEAMTIAPDRPFTPQPPMRPIELPKHVPLPPETTPYFPPPAPPMPEVQYQKPAYIIRTSCASPMLDALTIAPDRPYSPLPSAVQPFEEPVEPPEPPKPKLSMISALTTAPETPYHITGVPDKQPEPVQKYVTKPTNGAFKPISSDTGKRSSLTNTKPVPLPVPETVKQEPQHHPPKTFPPVSDELKTAYSSVSSFGSTSKVQSSQSISEKSLKVEEKKLIPITELRNSPSFKMLASELEGYRPSTPSKLLGDPAPVIPYYQQNIGEIPLAHRPKSPMPHQIKAPMIHPTPPATYKQPAGHYTGNSVQAMKSLYSQKVSEQYQSQQSTPQPFKEIQKEPVKKPGPTLGYQPSPLAGKPAMPGDQNVPKSGIIPSNLDKTKQVFKPSIPSVSKDEIPWKVMREQQEFDVPPAAWRKDSIDVRKQQTESLKKQSAESIGYRKQSIEQSCPSVSCRKQSVESTSQCSMTSCPRPSTLSMNVPPKPSSSTIPPAAGPGGASKSGAVAGTSAPRWGRGLLNPNVGVGARIPLCGQCHRQIRGPFITALGKIWCPEHFVCANAQCRRPLQDIGFVEEAQGLYCEYCFEQYLAPACSKCNSKIKGDCLNAIGKHFHPECFTCAYCGKLFGNSPFFLEDALPYCENDWNELFTTKCFACGFPIEAGDRWVEALNNNYHSQCFNCTMCKKNLEGQSFYAKGGRPFCKTHAR